MRICFAAIGLLAGLTWSGCTSTATKTAGPPDWRAWKAKRLESIAGTNGWTTLIARHWMPEGSTFVGADPTNHLVLPAGRAPASIGQFIRHDQEVRFEAAPDVIATINGSRIQQTILTTDLSNAPTRLIIGPLSFVVIERGERLGLRVRDPEAPSRTGFKGLDCFPYDPAWRLEGRFEPVTPPRTLRVQDVLGGTQDYVAPGAIAFFKYGTEYRLDVVEEPGEEDYFVIFRDRTAGQSTYGAGRFLYVARPGADGRVLIDFNRAYTPPCGFTPFAVCPLPPRQNWLPFGIEAGERKPAGNEH